MKHSNKFTFITEVGIFQISGIFFICTLLSLFIMPNNSLSQPKLQYTPIQATNFAFTSSSPGFIQNGNDYSFDAGLAGIGLHDFVITYTDVNNCEVQISDNISVIEFVNIQKTANVSAAAPGDFIEYTFTFTNPTSVFMNDIAFSDILDPNLINPVLIGGSSSIGTINYDVNTHSFTTNPFAVSSTVGLPPGSLGGTVTCTIQVQVDPNYSFSNVGINCLPTLMNCVSLMDNIGNPIPCAISGCTEITISNVGTANTPILASALLAGNSAYFNGNYIPISGTLLIDVNLTAIGCHFVMAPDAEIVIAPTINMNVINCQFYGCDYMWKGLTVKSTAGLRMSNSEMKDAMTALVLEHGCFSNIQMNTFTDNFVGIYVPTLYPFGYNGISNYGSVGIAPFTGNTFTSYLGTGVLKPLMPASTLSFPPNAPTVLGTLPFAGMLLNDVFMSIGNSMASSNLFYTMNCGIRAINCQLNIENSIFKNIHHHPPYTTTIGANATITGDGAGIWATKPQGYDMAFPTIRQRGFGNAPSSAYSFDECEEGIFATGVHVKSILNNMIRIRRTAYEIVPNVDGMASVVRNRISSDWGGILINAIANNISANPTDNISASYNNINITGDLGGNEFGIIFYAAKGQLPPASTYATARIYRDTITLNKRSGRGIWLFDCEQVNVAENEVHIRNNPFNFYTVQQGIVLQGGNKHIVSCNVIDGDVNNDQMKQRAIYVFQNFKSEISCNSTNGTGIGALFVDDCNSTRWQGNHLYDHYRGLSVGLNMANNPQMGSQDYQGNLWLGMYGDPTAVVPGGGACFMDLIQSNYINSKFKVSPNGSSDNHPEYPSATGVGEIFPPIIAPQWFDNLTSTTEFDCMTGNVCPNTQLKLANTDSTYSNRDSLVALRNWNPEYNEETAKYNAAKQLYEKVLADSLANGIFQVFKDSIENETSIPDFVKIEKGASGLDYDFSVFAHVTDSLMELMQEIDSLILVATSPQDSLQSINAKTGLVQTLQQYHQDFFIDYAPVYEAKNLQLDSLYQLNEEIVATEIATQNAQNVNRIYLNLQRNGLILDSLDLETVYNLASQCPLAGGEAVYLARSIYSLFSDTTFNDEEICPANGIFLKQVATENSDKIIATWVLGYGDSTNNPLLGNFDVIFTKDSMYFHTGDRNIEILATNTSMCDTSGNLLFYTNGIDIHNSVNAIMENGDTLIDCQMVYDYIDGLPIQQGVMALPRPNHSGQYWLFLSIFEEYPSIQRALHLYANLIDMSYNNNLGKVIQKGKVILTDSLTQGGLNAVKHANGRDWWIISVQARTDSSNCYHLHLLTPDSIIYQGLQCLGGKRIEDVISSFSPDGDWLVCTNGLNKFSVFSFDRCVGLLKLQNEIECSTSGILNIVFSPNSQYLYVNNVYDGKIYQYDLLATDIANSETIVWENGGIIESFLYMITAPNGKIYAVDYARKHFHVINYPDSLGIACNVEIKALTLPKYINAALPHYPYYDLGAAIGSGCDTLVSYQSAVSREQVKVYPNPVVDKLTIETTQATNVDYTFANIWGQTLLQGTIRGKEEIALDGFSSGFYYLLFYKEGQIVQREKIVIQR